MQQIIHLKPDDDIASVRARIEAADLSHVVLVIPRGCAILKNERGLQLLRRAAEDAGVELGLVVHDEEIRDYVGAFGFPMFHSIAQAQRARWRMQPLARETVQGTPKRALIPRRYGAGPLGVDRLRQWGGVIVAGLVVSLGLCIAAVLFVPTANVRIVPSAIALTVTTEVLADPSIVQINSDTRSIPARRLTREISGTMSLKTTTEKSIPNAPSTGTVILSNLRAEATMIPQGTIVKTSAGVPIRFSTVTTATLPAGLNSRVEVPIQAVDPGPVGNVKELAINTIEGTLALEARVINLKPTASGSLKPVKVVTADDKKKLEGLLLQQLRQQGTALLQKNLKQNEFLPLESVLLDVNDQIFDHVVDDPADVLNLRITAVAFGLAVDQEDTAAIVRAMLQKQMQAGYQLLPNSVQVDALSGGKYQGIALDLPIRGIGYATPQIDTNKVIRGLQGKSADEAATYLSSAINLAQPADIRITPIGWNRMPWLGFRIAVFVEPQAVGRK
jgi:hypothetical protein